jgi:hypothetical protein
MYPTVGDDYWHEFVDHVRRINLTIELLILNLDKICLL